MDWCVISVRRGINYHNISIFKHSKNRVYYTAAQKYEFYFRVIETKFYEKAQRVSKIYIYIYIFFLPQESKIHIFKPLFNFLFII